MATVQAHKGFISSCATFVSTGRDWNNEFQTVCESDDSTVQSTAAKWKALTELVDEFDEVAATVAERLFSEGLDATAEIKGCQQCYRVGNVFFRVWNSMEPARSLLNSFKLALSCMQTLTVSVPLVAMTVHKGCAVTAHALIPLSKEPEILYRGDGVPDNTISKDVQACVIRIIQSLNLPLPESTAGQTKVHGIEVLGGLDGRKYLTLCNGLLQPINSSDGPTLRGDYLLQQVEPIRSPTELATNLIFNTKQILTNALIASVAKKLSDQDGQTALCELFHSFHMNLCFLGAALEELVDRWENSGKRSAEEHEAGQRLAVEVLCRTLKCNAWLEIESKRLMSDEPALEVVISKTLRNAFEDDLPRFNQKVFNYVTKKFMLEGSERRAAIRDVILTARAGRRSHVIRRFCELVGATMAGGGKATAVWNPLRRWKLLPPSVHPSTWNMQAIEELPSSLGTKLHILLPRKALMHMWDLETSEAVAAHREIILKIERLHGKEHPSYYEALKAYARVLFLSRPPDVPKGKKLFEMVIEGYAQCCGRRSVVTVLAELDFANLLLKKGEPEEAALRFHNVASSLAASHIRPQHGGSLLLQPFVGLLKCAVAGEDIDLAQLATSTKAVTTKCRHNSGTLRFLSDFGAFALQRVDYPVATDILTHAVDVAAEAFGSLSPESATVLTDAAFAYYSWDLRKYGDQCEKLMRAAADATSSSFGPRSKEQAVALNNLATCVMQRDKLTEALTILTEAEELFNETTERSDPSFKTCRKNLAILRNRLRIRAVFIIQRWVRKWKRRDASNRAREYRQLEKVVAREFEVRMDILAEESAARELLRDEFISSGKCSTSTNAAQGTDALAMQQREELETEEASARDTVITSQLHEFRAIEKDFFREAGAIEADLKERTKKQLAKLELEEEEKRSTLADEEQNTRAKQRSSAMQLLQKAAVAEQLKLTKLREADDRKAALDEERSERETLRSMERAFQKEAKQKSNAKRAEAIEKVEAERRKKLLAQEDEQRFDLAAAQLQDRAAVEDEASRVVDGKMPKSRALRYVAAAFKGFAARKKMGKKKALADKRKKMAPIAAFIASHHSQRVVIAKATEVRCVAAIQQFMRFRWSMCALALRMAGRVAAVMSGYRTRWRLAKRRMAQQAKKNMEQIKSFSRREAQARVEIEADEKEAQRALQRQLLAIKERARVERQRAKEDESARRLHEAKLQLAQEDEGRLRRDVAMQQLAEWSKLQRAEKKERAALKRKPSRGQLAPSEPSSLMSTQGVQTDETADFQLPPVPLRRRVVQPTRPHAQQQDSARRGGSHATASTPRNRPPTGSSSLEDAQIVVRADPTLQGFPIDEVAAFFLEYEGQLLQCREWLLDFREELQENLETVVEARDRINLSAIPPGTAWLPARPGTSKQPLVYDGRVVLYNKITASTLPASANRRNAPQWNSSSLSDRVDTADKLRSIVDEFCLGWERTAQSQHVDGVGQYLGKAKTLGKSISFPRVRGGRSNK